MAGSALNTVFRLLSGHRADRCQIRHLPVVAAQMLRAAVAFAVGWSWPGLLLYAVVRIGRDLPAKASGVVQAGAFAGGATGPVAFGFVVDASGYETAWPLAGLLFFAAAMHIVLARRLFADLVARPPRDTIAYDGGAGMPRPRSPSSDLSHRGACEPWVGRESGAQKGFSPPRQDPRVGSTMWQFLPHGVPATDAAN